MYIIRSTSVISQIQHDLAPWPHCITHTNLIKFTKPTCRNHAEKKKQPTKTKTRNSRKTIERSRKIQEKAAAMEGEQTDLGLRI